jgi:hypothetical protein
MGKWPLEALAYPSHHIALSCSQVCFHKTKSSGRVGWSGRPIFYRMPDNSVDGCTFSLLFVDCINANRRKTADAGFIFLLKRRPVALFLLG